MNIPIEPAGDPKISGAENVVPMNDSVGEELEIQKRKVELHKKCPGFHRDVVVCEKTRTLECRHCGFVINAFDYILQWANEGSRRMSSLKGISVRCRVAHAEHDDLMRKVKNMRQQLKRGGFPQPQVERQAYDQARWNADNPSHAMPFELPKP